jgi:hypothetical protein
MSALDCEKFEPTTSVEAERSLAEVADWGSAEDWTDWLDAVGSG